MQYGMDVQMVQYRMILMILQHSRVTNPSPLPTASYRIVNQCSFFCECNTLRIFPASLSISFNQNMKPIWLESHSPSVVLMG